MERFWTAGFSFQIERFSAKKKKKENLGSRYISAEATLGLFFRGLERICMFDERHYSLDRAEALKIFKDIQRC